MTELLHTSRSDEILDVVDVYGNPTGQALDKKTIHSDGIRHRDTHVWITNGQELLQQQRTQNTTIMPGEWDISVGGHVNAGESYLDAAIRETQEELGLTFARERFIRMGKVASRELFPGWKHKHNIVGDNFVIVERDLTLGDIRMQPEEVDDVRMYPIDQLEDDLVLPETARRHAPQPRILYALGIAGMRGAAGIL